MLAALFEFSVFSLKTVVYQLIICSDRGLTHKMSPVTLMAFWCLTLSICSWYRPECFHSHTDAVNLVLILSKVFYFIISFYQIQLDWNLSLILHLTSLVSRFVSPLHSTSLLYVFCNHAPHFLMLIFYIVYGMFSRHSLVSIRTCLFPLTPADSWCTEWTVVGRSCCHKQHWLESGTTPIHHHAPKSGNTCLLIALWSALWWKKFKLKWGLQKYIYVYKLVKYVMQH